MTTTEILLAMGILCCLCIMLVSNTPRRRGCGDRGTTERITQLLRELGDERARRESAELAVVNQRRMLRESEDTIMHRDIRNAVLRAERDRIRRERDALLDQVEALESKHWSECAQISRYDDELRNAKELRRDEGCTCDGCLDYLSSRSDTHCIGCSRNGWQPTNSDEYRKSEEANDGANED